MNREQIAQAKEIINQTVSALDYAKMIGMPVNRAGFTRCPFHPDKDASLKLYPGSRGWHCFGCGAGGDVIQLAKQYYSLSFPDAISRIADDTGITIPGKRLTYIQTEALRVAQERKEQMEREQAAEEQFEDAYLTAVEKWKKLDRLVERMAEAEWETLKQDFSDRNVTYRLCKRDYRHLKQKTTHKRPKDTGHGFSDDFAKALMARSNAEQASYEILEAYQIGRI